MHLAFKMLLEQNLKSFNQIRTQRSTSLIECHVCQVRGSSRIRCDLFHTWRFVQRKMIDWAARDPTRRQRRCDKALWLCLVVCLSCNDIEHSLGARDGSLSFSNIRASGPSLGVFLSFATTHKNKIDWLFRPAPPIKERGQEKNAFSNIDEHSLNNDFDHSQTDSPT